MSMPHSGGGYNTVVLGPREETNDTGPLYMHPTNNYMVTQQQPYCMDYSKAGLNGSTMAYDTEALPPLNDCAVGDDIQALDSHYQQPMVHGDGSGVMGLHPHPPLQAPYIDTGAGYTGYNVETHQDIRMQQPLQSSDGCVNTIRHDEFEKSKYIAKIYIKSYTSSKRHALGQ
uniref:Uncharacterized protein n=2 Tax=Lygus hesperus TaxID=30085 RepID=A0A146LG97_LYGHE